MLIVEHNEDVVGGWNEAAGRKGSGVDCRHGDGDRCHAMAPRGIGDCSRNERDEVTVGGQKSLEVDDQPAVTARGEAPRDVAGGARQGRRVGSEPPNSVWM